MRSDRPADAGRTRDARRSARRACRTAGVPTIASSSSPCPLWRRLIPNTNESPSDRANEPLSIATFFTSQWKSKLQLPPSRPIPTMERSKTPVRRCAVYTRKSSEEGLEQDFNSLHVQREACEAFVKSQAGEGWRLVKTAYDDGGLSGGTMERPALQRLLADISQGLIDVVVVYKVDRLTRSLTDFAKMVEVFDACGVSFVAVTQQFNTTTSMGRLTLNVLLSFAQFEREVTGERIRDKIAASKQKGMWMGGLVPLGYDVHERRLAINQSEAETVREIFRRYLALGSVRLLMEDLNRRGIRSKVRVAKNGRNRQAHRSDHPVSASLTDGTASLANREFGNKLRSMGRTVVVSGAVAHRIKRITRPNSACLVEKPRR